MNRSSLHRTTTNAPPLALCSSARVEMSSAVLNNSIPVGIPTWRIVQAAVVPVVWCCRQQFWDALSGMGVSVDDVVSRITVKYEF